MLLNSVTTWVHSNNYLFFILWFPNILWLLHSNVILAKICLTISPWSFYVNEPPFFSGLWFHVRPNWSLEFYFQFCAWVNLMLSFWLHISTYGRLAYSSAAAATLLRRLWIIAFVSISKLESAKSLGRTPFLIFGLWGTI